MSSPTDQRRRDEPVDPISDRSRPFPLPREQRYPLDLAPTRPHLRAFFLETNGSMFDPEIEVPWDSFDRDAYEPATVDAAALIWSMRAWSEFRAIAEHEATLVRMCIETGREADLKYALAAAATDHAGLADACRLVATAFGGYRRGPDHESSPVANHDVIRRALHAETDPDTFFVSRLIVVAGLDLAEWEAALAWTDCPVATTVLARGVRDKTRALTAAHEYLGPRLAELTDDDRVRLAASIAAFLADDIPRAVVLSRPGSDMP
ncbi:MAG: hypothetical protein OEU32_16465, partial [Acidimicrobiia bacterium]|nr:hypothetical protein [Acidimicrobiia bacterium]